MSKLFHIFALLSLFQTNCQEEFRRSGFNNSEKYVVYASIINTLVDSTRIEILGIADSTFPDEWVSDPENLELMSRWWADFEPDDFILEPDVVKRQPLHRDSIDVRFEIRSKDEVTHNALRKGNTATLTFSDLVTNLEGDEALVYVRYSSSLGSGALWFWMGKSGREWRVLERRLVMVS